MATSRSLADRSLTTSSPRRIVPSVTSSSPATIRSAVVLPQPDGPTRTTNSPSSTKRSSACTASTPFAKTLVTCSSASVAIAVSLLSVRRGDPDPHPALPPVGPGEVRDRREGRRCRSGRRRQPVQVAVLGAVPAVEVTDGARQRDGGQPSELRDRAAVHRRGGRVDRDGRQV